RGLQSPHPGEAIHAFGKAAGHQPARGRPRSPGATSALGSPQTMTCRDALRLSIATRRESRPRILGIDAPSADFPLARDSVGLAQSLKASALFARGRRRFCPPARALAPRAQRPYVPAAGRSPSSVASRTPSVDATARRPPAVELALTVATAWAAMRGASAWR